MPAIGRDLSRKHSIYCSCPYINGINTRPAINVVQSLHPPRFAATFTALKSKTIDHIKNMKETHINSPDLNVQCERIHSLVAFGGISRNIFNESEAKQSGVAIKGICAKSTNPATSMNLTFDRDKIFEIRKKTAQSNAAFETPNNMTTARGTFFADVKFRIS